MEEQNENWNNNILIQFTTILFNYVMLNFMLNYLICSFLKKPGEIYWWSGKGKNKKTIEQTLTSHLYLSNQTFVIFMWKDFFFYLFVASFY